MKIMKNMKNKFSFLLMAVVVIATVSISACKKDKKDVVIPPIGGYNNSDEIAASNMVAKWSFENNTDDAKASVTVCTSSNTSFFAGAKGQAWKGSTDGYTLFSNAGTLLPALQSFTVAFWINTNIHAEGAQGLFMLSDSLSWIGNLFVTQEPGIIGVDSVFFKIKFDNWDAPSWKEQWIALDGKYKVPAITGKWAHLAFSYDGTTSKFAAFVNGVKMVLPSNFTDRFGSDPAAGGVSLGNMKFHAATKFIFGTYQSTFGIGGNPQSWMANYDGGLDEFRIYNKALTDTDVNSLYELEKAGR
jgi:hypothetical protein